MFVTTLLAVARGATGDPEPGEDNQWDVVGEKSAEASTKDEDSEDEKTEKKSEEKEKPSFKRREIPKISIPEHLKDNAFLKVLQIQAAALLSDMDDSEEAEEKKRMEEAEAEGKEGKAGAACVSCL